LPGFVPVRLTGPSQQGGDQSVFATLPADSSGIAISLPDGTQLHISHSGQLPLLRGVLVVLRQ